MNIANFIKSIKDPRRKEGQRYPFEAMMWMIFLSIACGHHSYRKMHIFCETHKDFFESYFNLKYGIPSHVTIFKLFFALDSDLLSKNFNDFMSHEYPAQANEWVSGDGQVLRATLKFPNEKEQDYCSIVSLFCQNTGLTVALNNYLNKTKSEGETSVFLALVLNNLRDKGVIFTLDALHCQKKH
jgi:hypothetical protein